MPDSVRVYLLKWTCRGKVKSQWGFLSNCETIQEYIGMVAFLGTAPRELWRFMFCASGVTILTSSMKSSARHFRAAWRSFTERRNKGGPIREPCGTPLRIGMVPKSSIQTCGLETRLVRFASIHHKTTSPKATCGWRRQKPWSNQGS